MRYGAKKRKSISTLLLISVIVYFFLTVFWKYFGPAVLAFLFLMAVIPAMDRLGCRWRVRRGAAAYLIVLMIIVILTGGVCFGLIPFFQHCDFSWCARFWSQEYVQKAVIWLQEKAGGELTDLSFWAARALGGFLFYLGAFAMSVFLMAGLYDRIVDGMEQLVGGKLLLELCRDVLDYGKAYMKTQSILMVLMWVIICPVLWLMRVQGGLLWGMAAGIFDFLPVFGIGFVMIPLTLWQFLQKNTAAAIVCVVLYFVCSILRELLEPKLLGDSLRLPALGMWISIFAGLQLFGASGIFKGPVAYLLIDAAYRRVSVSKEESGE
ncbi:MAG: AI-2E family transporter [Lachnospiraceae bacterium]|nr:AI-2E family transporter [Lachnospiraceae bacterium]